MRVETLNALERLGKQVDQALLTNPFTHSIHSHVFIEDQIKNLQANLRELINIILSEEPL